MKQFIADRKAIAKCIVFEELNDDFIILVSKKIEDMIRHSTQWTWFTVTDDDLSNVYLYDMTSMTPSLYDRDNAITKDIQAFFNFKGYTCIVKCKHRQPYDTLHQTSYSIALSCESHLSVDVKEVVDDDWPA